MLGDDAAIHNKDGIDRKEHFGFTKPHIERVIIDDGVIEYTGNTNTDDGNPSNNGAGRAFTIGASGATLTSSTPAGQKWVIGLDNRSSFASELTMV